MGGRRAWNGMGTHGWTHPAGRKEARNLVGRIDGGGGWNCLRQRNPSVRMRITYRLDATANDEAGTAHGGTMSAGEKSIKQALEAVEENGTEREGRICLTRQILVPPAARMHRHSGQMRHVPPFPFRFLLQLLREVSGHFTSRHCPASSRTHLVIRCCIQTVVKSSFPRGALVR